MGDKTREELHRTYGGLVYAKDYYNETSMAAMAKRITADFEFDERCRENIESNLSQ